MRRSPDSTQRGLFGDPPTQRALALDSSGELSLRQSRAIDEIESGVRFLIQAASEATCARSAAVGTEREYALVEAIRILEAARCACLNARSLLSTIPPGPVAPVAPEDT